MDEDELQDVCVLPALRCRTERFVYWVDAKWLDEVTKAMLCKIHVK
jgi:hypothetical protein